MIPGRESPGETSDRLLGELVERVEVEARSGGAVLELV
jgi:hypothetical protein